MLKHKIITFSPYLLIGLFLVQQTPISAGPKDSVPQEENPFLSQQKDASITYQDCMFIVLSLLEARFCIETEKYEKLLEESSADDRPVYEEQLRISKKHWQFMREHLAEFDEEMRKREAAKSALKETAKKLIQTSNSSQS